MLILFALIFGGNGFGGWGNRGGSPVTEADLCNANNFSDLKNQVGRMGDQQAAIARQTDNAIATIGYQNLDQAKSIMQQISECCCTTQRAIDSVKFDMANYSAATNATVKDMGQKILDHLCQRENAAIRDENIELKMDRALRGIPRTSPFGYGIYPLPGFAPCANGGFNI